MANSLPCDNHLDQLAVMLMTNLESGDTLTLCGPCVVEWAEMLVGGGPDEPEPQPAAPEATEEVAQLEPEPQPAAPEATEEVAQLEPEPPAPDASSKSEATPEKEIKPESPRRSKTTTETETAGQ